MDWIERWFGVAPDNGDGTLELVIMITIAAAAVLAVIWRIPRTRTAAVRFFSQLNQVLRGRREG
jgi:hypothetical protein